jgi:hypothetical protein
MLGGTKMMSRAMAAMWLVLGVGCVAPDPAEEAGEVEQHGICTSAGGEYECDYDCGGCGHNGLREPSWSHLFHGFNKPTLRQYGMWVDYVDSSTPHGAKSLCIPAQTYGDHCVMRWGYSNWIAANSYPRVDIMGHVVAAIAQTGYRVIDPGTNGNTYWGSFALRPQALTETWDYRTQETISAALLAQLNAVPGVAICLMNEQTPNNCTSYNDIYGKAHEADFFGNHFQYYFAGIMGGVDAPDPHHNPRYGAVDSNPQDPDPPARAYNRAHGVRCEYHGDPASSTGHAKWCLGEDGTLWDYPVTVRGMKASVDWYYGGKPKPANYPKVPIEY